MSERRREESHPDKYRGSDPVQTAWTQSKVFNTAWLKNGESLSPLQRLGFAIISLFFVASGLYLARFAVMFAREWDFMVVIFGPVCLGFLFFGVLGLRNVLRFDRREREK